MAKFKITISNMAGLVLFLALFNSCRFIPASIFPEGEHIFGLASIIELDETETTVFLTDFFRSDAVSKIDSIEVHPSLRARLSDDKKYLQLRPRHLNLPPISEIVVWLDGVSYSLIARRPVKVAHAFRFDPGNTRYRNVSLRGEMTEWNPEPMTLVDGIWQLTLRLNPGRYPYLFVANGRDIVDPDNPLVVSNNSGGFHSMLEIGNFDITKHPRIAATGFRKNIIEFLLSPDVEDVIVLWQNFRIPADRIQREGNLLKVSVPGDAMQDERSFMRIYITGNNIQGNDLLIPLQNGVPVIAPGMLTREDREATIMYFLMVDRFHNGNTERDDPVHDPQVDPRANFYGGDLDGVLEKLREGYFEELGVNAVWFSPITQNPLEAYVEFPQPRRKYTGYHGYWPITLTTIDHRFGDDQVLENLVSAAHQKNISVLMDFVSNHVHEKNPLIVENPDWATPLVLPDGRRNIRIWDEHRLTTWFDDFLPSLDLSKPEVMQTMVDSAFYWIDRFNLDGFRHDATKHVPLEFWRAITQKLKEEKMIPQDRRLFQIGETFGSRELIGSYIGSGLLDGKFDFNLYWDARAVFALDEEPFSRLDHSLHRSLDYYGFQNLMGNITGNHDMPRFISYAGGDLSFDEDDTQAGWQREVGVGDRSGYKKLSALTAFIMTIPGIPVIYYGDEIGLPGANDPDSRRPMVFDDLTTDQAQVREVLKKLTRLRTNNLSLIYGDFNRLQVTDHTYVYARSYFNNRTLMVFNKSNESRTITFDLPTWYQGLDYAVQFGATVRNTGNRMEVRLPPYSFEILTHR
jgi:cyclomaltodextrinase / maltogenic alpha-amylase / neopullulanase